MSGVRAVLFDLDGTLVDSYHLYLESYRRALEPMIGYAPTDDELLARGTGSERSALRGWVGEDRLAECHDSLIWHYERLHGALCEGLYDGVPEMLTALRTAGYPLGIVTGKGRRAWTVTAARLPLPTFDVVVTEDDVAHPKPNPAGLLDAARALSLAPAACLYVGDSPGDLAAATAAGMPAAAALWPKTAPGEREAFLRATEALAPVLTPATPAELTRALARWC